MFEFENKIIETEAPPQPDIKPNIKPTLALDTQKTPLTSIVTNVSGMKWIVEYYRQYLTQDMQPAPLDLEREEVHQQYLKIRDYELRVEQGLNPQQDPSTKEFMMSGSATVYPGMVPIKSDMFIANTGDGLYTLFVVTSVERMSNEQKSLYEIEYKAVTTLDEQYLENLTRKTSKEVVFNKDFLAIGKNPLLILEEEVEYQTAVGLLDEVARFYIDTFLDPQFDCFTVPDLFDRFTIDPLLADFIEKIIPKRNYPQYSRVISYNKHSVIAKSTFSVLDYLEDPSSNIKIKPFVQIIDMHRWTRDRFTAQSNGIDLSGYEFLITVRDSELEDENRYKRSETSSKAISLNPANVTTPLDFNQQVYSESTLVCNDIGGPYYIFTKAFYEQNYDEMSVIEKMTLNAIQEKEININSAIKMAEYLLGEAEPLQQYYFLPVMYRLLEMAMSEIN